MHLHDLPYGVSDPGEGNISGQERGHGDLVGGVENRRQRPPGDHGLPAESDRREALFVGRLEPEIFKFVDTQPLANGDRLPFRIGQRVLDRQPHVRYGDMGQEVAVNELHQAVHDALRMYDHTDPVDRDIEEPVRLDDLEPLVHEGCRVDGDLPPHGPGGMLEGPLGCDGREFVGRRLPEGTAGSGQDELGHLFPGMRAQRLEERAVLAVDRHQAGDPVPERLAGQVGDQAAANHQRFLVGQRHPLPRLERPDRRQETVTADHGVHDDLRLGMGRHPQDGLAPAGDLRRRLEAVEGAAECVEPGGVGDDGQGRLPAPHLLDEFLHRAPGPEGRHPDVVPLCLEALQHF